MNYKYTICFIKRNDEILLLNRENDSWMGCWNGVGGRLEDGESPTECILREVHEETGITLSDVTDCGVVTWMIDGVNREGMHIYLAEMKECFDYKTPLTTDEGILDWKYIDWILNPKNSGIAGNIPHILPYILGDMKRYHHHRTKMEGRMVEINSSLIEE